MKTHQILQGFRLAIAFALFALAGCDFKVPITAEPTRKIEPALLGEWVGTEWNENDCRERMKVRRYDDSSYVVLFDGDLHRAWHSDIGETAFVTVQSLDSPERSYSYFVWSLSDGGKRLTLRPVTDTLIPKETPDSATVTKLLRENLKNPQLLGKASDFTRKQE